MSDATHTTDQSYRSSISRRLPVIGRRLAAFLGGMAAVILAALVFIPSAGNDFVGVLFLAGIASGIVLVGAAVTRGVYDRALD